MTKEEKIATVLTETRKFDPLKLNPEFAKTGISFEEYKKEWKRSVEDLEGFWGEQAQSLDWFEPYEKVWERTEDDLFPGRWFIGGRNCSGSFACLARVAAQDGKQNAESNHDCTTCDHKDPKVW